MTWLSSAVLICVIFAYLSSPGRCTEWHGHNGWFYYIHNETVNFTEAKETCRGFGANLASIHSEDEDNFIANFSNQFNIHLWIGLVKDGQQGPNPLYDWLDGTNIDYLNWKIGLPDGFDCVVLTKNGDNKWDDRTCTDVSGGAGFACKTEGLPPVQSSVFAASTYTPTSTTAKEYLPPVTSPGHSTGVATTTSTKPNTDEHLPPVTSSGHSTRVATTTSIKPINTAVIIGATAGLLLSLAMLIFVSVCILWRRKRRDQYSTRNAKSQSAKIAVLKPYSLTSKKKSTPAQSSRSATDNHFEENALEVPRNHHNPNNTCVDSVSETSTKESRDIQNIDDSNYTTISINNQEDTVESTRPVSVLYAKPVKPASLKRETENSLETCRLRDLEGNEAGRETESDEGWEENPAYVGFEVDENAFDQKSTPTGLNEDPAPPGQQISCQESVENARPISVIYSKPLKSESVEDTPENPYELTEGATPVKPHETHVGGESDSNESSDQKSTSNGLNEDPALPGQESPDKPEVDSHDYATISIGNDNPGSVENTRPISVIYRKPMKSESVEDTRENPCALTEGPTPVKPYETHVDGEPDSDDGCE